jgi:mRNA interferase RelE/StbE
MNVEYRKRFARDLKRIRDPDVRSRIADIIDEVKAARSLHEIPALVKLRGLDIYYRIRVGDFRIGVVIEGNTLEFVCCLHRRDVYRFFPP